MKIVVGQELAPFFDEHQNVDAIIVFDGVCNFCNGWVSFVSTRDRSAQFTFAPAQSKNGRFLLKQSGFSPDNLETILLVSKKSVLAKSDAILMILYKLGGMWRVARMFLFVPQFVRDGLYSLIARKRYFIAGQRDMCDIPTEANGVRFLP